jgi:hypothetical protein
VWRKGEGEGPRAVRKRSEDEVEEQGEERGGEITRVRVSRRESANGERERRRERRLYEKEAQTACGKKPERVQQYSCSSRITWPC